MAPSRVKLYKVPGLKDCLMIELFSILDLSFQTAARILAAPTVDALMVMKDLSQNFPTKAR